MKKILTILSIIAVSCLMSSVSYAVETVEEQTKAESAWETVSVMSQAAAEKTAESVKSGSKKAGLFIKEKSTEAAEKATPHIKSGANKAKTATIRGANKVSNSTAKGMKKLGRKMQNHADRTIEKTDKVLEETAPRCKCNCSCGNDCKCNEYSKCNE